MHKTNTIISLDPTEPTSGNGETDPDLDSTTKTTGDKLCASFRHLVGVAIILYRPVDTITI